MAGAVAAAQDVTLRPLHTSAPTKLLVGKNPVAGQGTPEDPTAQDTGPGLARGRLHPSFKRSAGGIGCCWPVRAMGEKPQDFCSSQYPRTDPFNFQSSCCLARK